MAAVVDRLVRENELVALRFQQEELQAQQDALLAQQLALAYALTVKDDAANESTIIQDLPDAEGLAEVLQLQSQLAELNVAADRLLAESVHESITDDQQSLRASQAAAEALQAEEEWKARVAEHDRAFATKLARLDEETWENVGDELEEPFRVPLPVSRMTHNSASTSLPAPKEQPQPTRKTPKPTPATAQSSAGAGSASSGPPRTSAARGTVECLCCMDRFPEDEVTCAGADAASSSTASAGCGHYFCISCMTEYVRSAVKDRKYPIPCPMVTARDGKGCRQQLSRDSVLAALEAHPKDQQSFGILEAEQAIDPGLRIYCPHKDCSMPMELPDDEFLPPDEPTACPACGRVFCPRCLIPGWHNGYSCSQFQALPAHQRSAEDAAMLQFSARQQWKQCPQCRLMVERSEGCNHMLCRCGANFCYACGQPYKSKEPTADNVHGTPGCGCPLFAVPNEAEEAPAGAAGRPGPAAPRPRPWRGGRLVSRSRCRYAASIHDCPQGLYKCWFWHDEDDDA